MIFEIVLPFIPTTWNSLKGRGWIKYKKLKDETGMFMLPAKNKFRGYRLEGGVLITFIYGFTNNRRRDIDSLCTKPIVDSLVDMGLILDDNKNVVVETRNKWEFTPQEQTRIVIEDNQDIPEKQPTPRKSQK